MRVVFGLVLLAAMAASGCTEKCNDVGGQCLIGNHPCPNRGPQECSATETPAGLYCCLPCPTGKRANDAGTACE
jgi:hypothetical protein